MFTPQRNPWSANDRKGKSVAFSNEITTPSPSVSLLCKNDGGFGGVDDWQKFKEVGLLDEASLESNDREALIEKILKLEKELFDYQHNMGLLLIEKKKWTSKNEELQQAFDEATEILKHERTSNLIALNEADKREENLRKALIAERQCVVELEKDLQYWQREHSEVKSSSEVKLAEANDLVAGIKEKALEVDRERAIAEEKLSVIDRRTSELERKLKELETREKVLQREHLSLVTEREAHEAVFYKQREDLQEWEKKLTAEEDKLSEAKRSINRREENIMESERTIKKKEKVLAEMQQKIDIAELELKRREESTKTMLNDISLKEEDFEAIKTKVDMKEKELHEFEEKLIVREQMDIGKLLDDQKAVLDSRKQEFEMELEQMRISLDKELEGKKAEIEQLQVENLDKEEKLAKRESALEKMEKKVKEKDKDLVARLKAVKEKEKTLIAEEKKLHMENKERLRILKDEIEEIGAETTKQESRICEENENLKITKEERLEFLRLQSELKQQIDRVKQEEKFLLKKHEELKQDKERFEKEWEALDEKKTDIAREKSEVTEEKEKLRSLLIVEKHRLEREEMTSRDNLKRELDSVKMEKESFEADMEIKKLALHENAKNKTSQLVEDLEKQKRNLDMEFQRQEEEGEKDFNERARTYEKRSQEKLDNINCVKKLAQREMEEVQDEKLALEREREEISVQKKLLKEQEVEMHKDITELDALRSSLKEQREEFICARERFLVFLERLKSCSRCGEITENFVLSDFRTPDVEEKEKLSGKQKLKLEQAFNSSPDAENSRRTSLLGKIASKLLSLSPIGQTDKVTDLGITVKRPESSQPDETLDIVGGDDHEPSVTEQSFTDSGIQEGPEVFLQSEVKSDNRRCGRGRGKSVKGRSQATKAAPRDSKPDGEIPRKRQREHDSKITESEQGAGDSDEGVGSITIGGRRKKRQTAVPVSQTPRQSRYHLRRHRNVGTEEDKAQVSLGGMENRDSVNGDIRTVPSPKDNITPSQGENRENGKAGVLVEAVVTHERIDTVETKTQFKDNNTGKRPVEDLQLEAGGSGETREHGEYDENSSMIEEYEGEAEEEETERQGDASIGKKIWVFFTT